MAPRGGWAVLAPSADPGPLTAAEQLSHLRLAREAAESLLSEAVDRLDGAEAAAGAMVREAQALSRKVHDARDEMQDLYFSLQQKLDKNYEIIVALERRLVLQKVELELEQKRPDAAGVPPLRCFSKKRHYLVEAHEVRMKLLREQVEGSVDALRRATRRDRDNSGTNNTTEAGLSGVEGGAAAEGGESTTSAPSPSSTTAASTAAAAAAASSGAAALKEKKQSGTTPSSSSSSSNGNKGGDAAASTGFFQQATAMLSASDEVLRRYTFPVGDARDRAAAVTMGEDLERDCASAAADLEDRVRFAQRERVRHKSRLARQLADRAQADVDVAQDAAHKDALLRIVHEKHAAAAEALDRTARRADDLVHENKRLTNVRTRLHRDLGLSKDLCSETLHLMSKANVTNAAKQKNAAKHHNKHGGVSGSLSLNHHLLLHDDDDDKKPSVLAHRRNNPLSPSTTARSTRTAPSTAAKHQLPTARKQQRARLLDPSLRQPGTRDVECVVRLVERDIDDRRGHLSRLEDQGSQLVGQLDCVVAILSRALEDSKREVADLEGALEGAENEADVALLTHRERKPEAQSSSLSPSSSSGPHVWPRHLDEADPRDVPPLLHTLARSAHALRVDVNRALGLGGPTFLTAC